MRTRKSELYGYIHKACQATIDKLQQEFQKNPSRINETRALRLIEDLSRSSKMFFEERAKLHEVLPGEQ